MSFLGSHIVLSFLVSHIILAKYSTFLALPVKYGESFIFCHVPLKKWLSFSDTFLMFGSISGMVTLFIKLLVPVARPHFLSVCLNDDGQSTNIDYGVFSITVGNLCSNSNLSEIFEALRSFPSYHATIAIYRYVE